VRSKLFAALAALIVAAVATSGTASASVTPKVLSEWKKAEATFAPQVTKWSSALQSSNPSLSQISKACAAFVPYVKAFDNAIGKIAFTGKTATDISALLKLNAKEIAVIGHVTSLKSFETGMVPLAAQYYKVQLALGKDLGVPAAEVIL